MIVPKVLAVLELKVLIVVYGPRAAHLYGSSGTTRHACVSHIGGRTANGQGPDEDGGDDNDHEDICSPDADGLSAVPAEDQYSNSDERMG